MEELKIRKIAQKEYLVGENRVYLSDENVINVIPKGDQTEEIAKLQFEVNKKLCSLVSGKINYIIDLNNCGKNPPKARTVWNKINENEKTAKVAAFGIHAVAKVLASFVINFSTRNDMRFFKTREEAEDWIKM